MSDDQADLDEVLGRTRCARCGQALDGEIECPFCSAFPDRRSAEALPTWVYLTAGFLTSPLSIPFLLTTSRLTRFEKVFAGSGALMWGWVSWRFW